MSRTPLQYRASARRDLAEVYAYSAQRWGDEAAARYIEGLERAIARLVRFPKMGRAYTARLRRIRYEHHVVFYAVEDRIVVEAVRHERQTPLNAR